MITEYGLIIRSLGMLLFSAGAKEALLAKHNLNGTALAIIQILKILASNRGHTML